MVQWREDPVDPRELLAPGTVRGDRLDISRENAEFHTRMKHERTGPYRGAWDHVLDKASDLQGQADSQRPYRVQGGVKFIPPPPPPPKPKYSPIVLATIVIILTIFVAIMDFETVGLQMQTVGGAVRGLGSGKQLRSHLYDGVPGASDMELVTAVTTESKGMVEEVVKSKAATALRAGRVAVVDGDTVMVGVSPPPPPNDFGTCKNLVRGLKLPKEKVKKIVVHAVHAGMKTWRETMIAAGGIGGEELSGADSSTQLARNAMEGAVRAARANLFNHGAELQWPGQNQNMPFTWWPKLMIYADANTAGGLVPYEEQLEKQGWEYYIVGREVPADGAHLKHRAVLIFAALCAHPQMLIVTDPAEILVVSTPQVFLQQHRRATDIYKQGWDDLVGMNESEKRGYKDGVFFSARMRSEVGQYRNYHGPKRLFSHSNGTHQMPELTRVDPLRQLMPREHTATGKLQKVAAPRCVGGAMCTGALGGRLGEGAPVDPRARKKHDHMQAKCNNPQAGACWAEWEELAIKRGALFSYGRSEESMSYKYVFLDAGLYVGKARDILKMLQTVSMHSGEDEQVLLEEYWFASQTEVMLDYNAEFFATVESYPDASLVAEGNNWRYVCNLEAEFKVDSGKHATWGKFCHNLLHTCPTFLHTANTGDKNYQCLQGTYRRWYKGNPCGMSARPPAEVLKGLGPTWAQRDEKFDERIDKQNLTSGSTVKDMHAAINAIFE
ncbi:hypothetical protein CYMTET_45782 [Cymbomonas tetramitiformis]|uniref:Uncharacterized protein n=1 Tax=Cymbomonas tetramitiformis TaxID=36881 RepID=A0AAE0EXQ4_9CHLO|nr:hypothetical protein CYMTET_45782 [Cymbomonas tetramitiformis]